MEYFLYQGTIRTTISFIKIVYHMIQMIQYRYNAGSLPLTNHIFLPRFKDIYYTLINLSSLLIPFAENDNG